MRKKNQPVNQYLFYLLKALIRFNQKGTLHEDLTKEDYAEISAKTDFQLPPSTIIKMYTDPTRYKWGDEMLRYLCKALPDNCIYKNNFDLFVEIESNHPLYEAVVGKAFQAISKELIRNIKKTTTRKALEIIGDNARLQTNIPIESVSDEFLSVIKIASDADVEEIYKIALNRYGDCDLNPPSIKLPWKKINDKIFYVIHGTNGEVQANINLLPIKESCFQKLKSGRIEENEIKPEDILPLHDRQQVKHLYVEGLNCQTKEQLLIFGEHFHQMVGTLACPENDLTISAIGGTPKGEKIMQRLEFRITGKYKKGNYDFFECSYNIMHNEIKKIFQCNF